MAGSTSSDRLGPHTDITNVELGYRLRRSTWNMGYATEGSRAAHRWRCPRRPV